MSETGTLFVCATPIGNLGDVTARVIETLRSVDLILAEDTRVTSRLLARYGLDTALERYDEHTAARKTPAIIDRLGGGADIAVVSDAGTPGISDPGQRLVAAALEAGLPVDVLPGPSAIVTALVASGLPTEPFYFGGFLPRKAGERTRYLTSLTTLDATLVFYESPRRTASTLRSIADVMPGRTAAVARELTKIHQEVVRDTIEHLAEEMERRELKGEVVLVIGPPRDERPEYDETALLARVDELVSQGESRSDAVREVASAHGIARKDLYRIVHGRED